MIKSVKFNYFHYLICFSVVHTTPSLMRHSDNLWNSRTTVDVTAYAKYIIDGFNSRDMGQMVHNYIPMSHYCV